MKTLKKYAAIVALIALGVVVAAVAPENLPEFIEEVGKAIVFVAATKTAEKIITHEKNQVLRNNTMCQYTLERTA